MSTVRTWLRTTDKPSQEEIDEMKSLDKTKIVYDEDCPKLTKEQLQKMVEDRKNRTWNPAFRTVGNINILIPSSLHPKNEKSGS